MHNTDDEAARIVAGLTKAQREALTSSLDIGIGFITTFESHRSAKALKAKGLTHLWWSPSGLTDLGIRVRALLTEKPA